MRLSTKMSLKSKIRQSSKKSSTIIMGYQKMTVNINEIVNENETWKYDLFLRSQLLQIWEESAGLSFGGTAWPTITGKGKGLSQNWQFFASTGDNFWHLSQNFCPSGENWACSISRCGIGISQRGQDEASSGTKLLQLLHTPVQPVKTFSGSHSEYRGIGLEHWEQNRAVSLPNKS